MQIYPIKLEEYEEICPECGGTCFRQKPFDIVDLHNMWCLRCNGTGKIDFIDRIKNARNKT